jgi:hypothetical protein
MMETMTVHERLLELGANAREARQAEALLARLIPHGRSVEITDEVLVAARAGFPGAVAALLAEEVEPDDDDLAALADADAVDDGTLTDLDEFLREQRSSRGKRARRAS